VTAFDLAADPHLGGGISNVATVLAELVEEQQLEASALREVASSFSLAATRRLGLLLEAVDAADLASVLHELVEQRRRHPAVLLSPDDAAAGEVNRRWRLRMNATIEPDL
jgi:predicted transcriptional regulator of viral defense system